MAEAAVISIQVVSEITVEPKFQVKVLCPCCGKLLLKADEGHFYPKCRGCGKVATLKR